MAAWPLPDNNRLMTLKTYLSAVMLAVAFLCTSCLNSDDEVVTYEDTAVTAFTLGTVKCYRTVKTASGRDSTYSYTYSASTLPVYIDQINNRIYNEDSLTVGTDVSRVLTSISTKNNGVALLRNLTDDNWTLYSSSDSLTIRSSAHCVSFRVTDSMRRTILWISACTTSMPIPSRGAVCRQTLP